MAALFAFLHHLAAFALVSAIAVEFALIKGELNVANARKILRADQIYGAAAGALFVIGLLRVFFFEKGAAYYFHSVPFIAKLSLFAAVGLLSIYPTRRILSWRAALKEGRAPSVTKESRSMRAVIHWELAGVVLILLCAALMARGVGYFGA
jgi:putative membrane protein